MSPDLFLLNKALMALAVLTQWTLLCDLATLNMEDCFNT
jgi:hypothetical protein